MRSAVTASVLVHFGLIAGALVALNWPETLDPASIESISVDLVTLEEFTSTTAEAVTPSMALETMLAAGAETVAPSEAEPVETTKVAELTPEPARALPMPDAVKADPVQTAAIPTEAVKAEAVKAEAVRPVEVAAADPVEAASAAVLTAELSTAQPVEGLIPEEAPSPAQAVEIAPTAATEAVEVAPKTATEVTAEAAEVTPKATTEVATAAVVTAVEPEPEPPKEAPKKPPKETPKDPPKDPPKKKPKKQATPPPTAPGAGGNSNANQQASAPSGGQGQNDAAGNAAVSKYPGQVQAKLRRALRYPSGAGRVSGEVRVQFVVSASGSVSGIKVVGSSGNTVLDQAAIATVKRAAPFPPIPPAAGKATWTFVIPLLFQR